MINLAKFKARYAEFEADDALIQQAIDDANNIITEHNAQDLASADQVGADIAIYRLVNKSDTYLVEQYQGIYDNAMKQLMAHYKRSQLPIAPKAGIRRVETNGSAAMFGRDKGVL